MEATTIDDPRALADLVIWRQPLAFGDPATAPARAVACWQEAALLGLTGAGAVTPAARALLGGADDLTVVLGDVGSTQHEVRLQADLTAVVAGSPEAALSALLDLAAEPETRGVGLRQLAPTVLAAAVPLHDVLAALRGAGYAPVAEGEDGAPILERAVDHRASASPSRAVRANSPARPRTAAPRRTATRADAASLARKLLAAPDETLTPITPSLDAVRRSATRLGTSEARMLAHAIDHRQPVTISYVNRDGNPSSRTIDSLQLTGGYLLAWCRLREDERWFNLKRIVGVQPADLV
ncbi:helix-turn-helix transcriptional regulator [Phytohabitans sp. LJ34]|uniref:helix-turn-helix transcriptional regulator n=1 Tax=Phytohabitans sp. LJ34 TaxID=3452217 RepID=UPI003F8AB2A1